MGQRCHTAFPSRPTSPKPMMESEIKWTVEGRHSAHCAEAVNCGQSLRPSTSRRVTVQWLKRRRLWDSALTDQSMSLYINSKGVEAQLAGLLLLEQTTDKSTRTVNKNKTLL